MEAAGSHGDQKAPSRTWPGASPFLQLDDLAGLSRLVLGQRDVTLLLAELGDGLEALQ